MSEVDRRQPYGQTPLTSAVGAAAEVLHFRERPAVIVLLTDGEETCRGNPCAGAGAEAPGRRRHGACHRLHAALRKRLSGGQSRCLSESAGGMFLSTETIEELSDALRKTLACPLISSRAARGRPAR
ncbi:MAG: hypothetical protein ABWY38_03325 [Methyloceanibacter sp.]